ncbi:MAG: WecB/TagA/CpsF family glycosyltransferase [Luteolibacter sp.]
MKNTQEPPMTVLLGLPFHDITLEETLDYCEDTMRNEKPSYLVTANVDFTTQAYEDADLKKIVFYADRVVCDGMPLVWLSRIFGYPLRERVAGSDMVPRLLEICGREKYGVYFFGSDLNTLEEAKVLVEERYPGLRVVGVDSPPFGAVIEWDNEALCERMRASGAKLLLACLGCPKQERWIFAHHRESGIPLSIGVGASLDFITGKQKRAPRWMQKTGMEWFWRMSSSPSRLMARYGKDFVFLSKASLRQAKSQRRREEIAGAVPQTSEKETASANVTRLAWSGNLQWSSLNGAPVPDHISAPVWLDASRISFTDSSGLGQLALLLRRCRAAGQPLVIINPSKPFRGALSDMQMDSLCTMVENEEQAEKLLENQKASGQGEFRNTNDGVVWVSFKCPLDAIYYDEMTRTLDAASEEAEAGSTLVIDLAEVNFIDSRAVGGLIRTMKQMRAKGGSMYLARANTSVHEIISLLRLDKLLPEWEGDIPS